MKILFIQYLILFAISLKVLSFAEAASERVSVSNDGLVTRFDKPCTDRSILERFTVAHQTELRAGTLKFNGQTLGACWVAGKKFVFVVDSSGDLSRVLLENFSKW